MRTLDNWMANALRARSVRRSVPDRSAEASHPLARLTGAVRRRHMASHLHAPGDQAPSTDILAPEVLDAAGSLVIVIDAAGVVAAINKAAIDATGYEREEVVGHPIFGALMAPEVFGHAQALHLRHTEASTGVPFAAPLLTKSGEERRVIWSSKLLHQRPGSTAHLILSGLDISADSTGGGLVSHRHLAGAGTCWVGTDLEGRVTLWSDEADQLLGYSRREMMGHTLPLALFDAQQLHERAARAGIPPDLRVLTADTRKFERRTSSELDLGFLDRRSRTPEHGKRGASDVPARPGGISWTLICRDGTRVTVAATIKAIRNASGEQVGFLGVGTDVTAQRRTQDLLVSALEREADAGQRLRELDEAKDRLIATVSHELRTPLTSIDGYTELLEDGLAGELNEQQGKHVDAIRRNTDRLSRLVEDLLALSGIEAGTLQSGHEVLDLRDAVRQAWEELEPTSASPRLAVSLELPPSPVVVRGDIAHLARAVSNLLSNSVKCTEGAGSVSCVLVTNDDRAILRVTDTGFGIPIQEQSSLFTRFFRTSTAQEREIPGSGLGLAIAAAVVHSCGGEISAESEHLGGAIFTIDLPLANADRRTLRAVS